MTAPAATYPLTPLQHGMLFHHLLEPAGGIDVEQLVFSLPEAVDTAALRAAWERAAARHAVLRTSFAWERRETPAQAVHERVVLPWTELDWRDVPRERVDDELRAWLAADRFTGFDLRTPPLQRVALIRVADDDYRLVWTFHHIILDGRSFTLVLEEIFGEYDAESRNARVVVPSPCEEPASPSFRTYAEWTASLTHEQHEATWREYLRDFTAPTPLPAAWPRALSPGETRAGQLDWSFSTETTSALSALAAEHGATLNTIVHAAWALVLAKHSGEKDIVFGGTRACRRNEVPGVEQMVGLLINTVPLRVTVQPDATIGEFLADVRSRWRRLAPLEQTPLARVQSWSDVRAGQSLFESLVVFENVLLEDVLRARGGAWQNRRVTVNEQPNVALTLGAYGGASLRLKLDHDRSRIDDDTAARLVAQLVTLIEGMAAQPDARVGDLPIMPAGEREKVVTIWNDTAVPRAEETMHGMFEAHVASRPDAEAVRAGDVALTYAQLNARADEVAVALREKRVGRGDIVALLVERNEYYPIGILGILKTGAAFLPLDSEHPAERQTGMLEDAKVRVLLVQGSLAARAPAAPDMLVIDELREEAEAGPSLRSGRQGEEKADCRPERSEGPAFHGVRPEDPCYVIYTSGSTGKPKGVQLHHRGACNLTYAFAQLLALDETSRVLQFASPSFDASVSEVLQSLCLGGTLHMMPTDVLRSPADLAARITSEEITLVTLPPTLLRVLDAATMPRLRALISAGEAIGADIIQRWGRGRRLMNGYGPTETTVCATAAICDPDDTLPPTIGRPLPNMRAYVLDERREPVPIGAPGRLWVGGMGVGDGYLNRPDLTAERFVADPFAESSDMSVRMYDTGDVARWRFDGNVEFLGRVDHQLKIRGFRIEPGEIELAMLGTAMIRECSVIGREDTPGDKRLVAYVVPENGVQLDADGIAALRHTISAKLPPYMVPSAIVVMDALPISSAGKVDRKRLPVPAYDGGGAARTIVAPRTPVEIALCQIWSSVLRVEHVGVEDNFFSLGGDSILMITVIARARDAGLELSPRDVHANPTVAQLAVALAARTARTMVETSEVELVDDVPLTPVQRWFFAGERDELNHWNQAFLLQVRAPLDRKAFEAALEAVTTRHSALRARFAAKDGRWVQSVAAEAMAAVTYIELSAVNDDALPTAIEAACRNAHASLDISNGPTMRVVYLDTGARAHRLFVVVHHLAVDGVSWGVLLADLERAYESAQRGLPISLGESGGSVGGWAARLEKLAASGALDDEVAYWEKAGAPARNLPTDRTLSAEDDRVADEAHTVLSLDANVTRDLLQRVPAAYRTQVNDVLLTALSRALAGWAGEGEVIIDLESHGREDLFEGFDISRTVGWFTAVYPVRSSVAHAPIPRALRSMKEQLRAVPRRGVGYGVLREIAQSPSLVTQAAPDLAFNYLGQMDQLLASSAHFSFAAGPSGAWVGERARRRHPIEINAMVMNGELTIDWSYNRRRHDQTTIARVAASFVSALREIVQHCTSENAFGYSPSDFPLSGLNQDELDRVVGASRDVDDIYPLVPIQRLFHGFADPANDPGFEQWRYRVTGALDLDALQHAWDVVVGRHAILRTAFVSERVSTPLQVVRRSGRMPIDVYDWRPVGADERVARLRDLLAADRARGFDFERPPLMRLTVIRLGDSQWEIVWSQHHLLMDRWSMPLVLREVRAAYEAHLERRDLSLPAPVQFREYVTWLSAQPDSASESFWRAQFEGHISTGAYATRIAGSSDGASVATISGDDTGDVVAALDHERTSALGAFAAAQGISLNTLIAGAWALWLARQTRADDVVIGLAVAGRPAEVGGVERMVGVTINNVPLRVRTDGALSVSQWLHDLQQRQLAISEHAHAPLERVQAWSGVPWRHRLFDSILVFQHGAADVDNASWLGTHAVVEPLPVATHTAYPISLVIGGIDALTVRVSHDEAQLREGQAAAAAHGLIDTLFALAGDANRDVAALLAALPAPTHVGDVTEARVGRREYVAPRTATQAVLARLLGDLLELERVGVTDDFFAMGGNSLVATQLASRIRDTLRMEVPVRLIFAHPTVEALARALAERDTVTGQLERIAKVVQRVQSMTMDEVRQASRAGAAVQ